MPSWIPMMTSLAIEPQVKELALAAKEWLPGSSPTARKRFVVGCLHATWAISHPKGGELTGYELEDLDELIGVEGWSQALADAGWLRVYIGGLRVRPPKTKVRWTRRHHYVYRLDLPESGRRYVGVRSTDSHPREDSYMGSGVALKGLDEPATKKILCIVKSRSEALRIERALVGPEQVRDPMYLNLRVGGA